MRTLLLLTGTILLAQAARIRRQAAPDSPNQSCCRCQDESAFCNNDLARPGEGTGTRSNLTPGLTCQRNVNCLVFNECNEDTMNCLAESNVGLRAVGETNTVRTAANEAEGCPVGQSLCCNPVPGSILQPKLKLRAGLVNFDDPLGNGGDVDVFPVPGNPGGPSGRLTQICDSPGLRAVINFNHGLTCGKRDSRVYREERKSEDQGGIGDVTNPGEWPWAVLIFNGDTYVGSGALMDNDVVATSAIKVQDFVNKPEVLTVRLGDFDPTNNSEEFPHVEMDVICVKTHPRFNFPSTLPYNIAVLKMKPKKSGNLVKTAASVIAPRSAPANFPEGFEDFKRNKNKDISSIGLRAGLLADLNSKFDALGEEEGVETNEPLVIKPTDEVEIFRKRSYINTVCLPRAGQFAPDTKCWVAAWGTGLKEQREVRLPLWSKDDCETELRKEFLERGVPQWDLSPSELCAGGELDKDTCEGEGGAPLVCLDENTDQFYAVGLVGWGFDCNAKIPAVYTNLADPDVKEFIVEAFNNPNYC